jgi:hypothetical protein
VSKAVFAIIALALGLLMGPVLLVAIGANVVEAQTGKVAEVSNADYSFGEHVTFHLTATAPVTITEVNLLLRVAGQSDTLVFPVSFDPGPQVAIDFPYNVATGQIPPFATVSYRWEIRDLDGEQRETEEMLLYYADNRYKWRSAADDQKGISLELYWLEGDVVFGRDALNAAVNALDEIYQELRAPVPGVIRIFVYPSEDELRSALDLTGYEWAGGQARPDLGVVLVGVPDGPGAQGEVERLIRHELTHLLVYEASGRARGRVPPWLDEGLATLKGRRADPNRDALLEQALAEDRLLPLVALCAPFSTDEDAARLAYAQSANLVHYIGEEYGSQAIRDLLAVYADGASCEAGVNQVLGKDLEGLDSAWRAYETRQEPVAVALNDSSPWLLLWLLTAVLALPLLGVIRGSVRSKGDGSPE